MEQPQRVLAGRYLLRGELGRGGMGVVWLAEDQVLGREVAVKEITYSVDVSDAERAVLRERTLREARAAARLDHPAVTTVHDVVEEDGKPWLVMEHVPSRTLLDLVESAGRLPVDVVARIGLDLLAGVQAAHAAGIVHRDVKPANVLVDDAGRAHLTDFGIATSTGDSSLTTRGAVLGSPAYMSPERATGGEPRPEGDLWSVGATLYTAVEGRPPFDRGEPMATLLAVVSDHPAPMVHAGPLQPVLTALLAKDPVRRATADQALAALAEALRAPSGPVVTPAAAPGPVPGPKRERPAGRDRADAGVDVFRVDVAELRERAHVAKEKLRALSDRHLPSAGPAAAPTPRRRFKRRWVVVPAVLLAALALLVVAGAVWLLVDLGSVLGG